MLYDPDNPLMCADNDSQAADTWNIFLKVATGITKFSC